MVHKLRTDAQAGPDVGCKEAVGQEALSLKPALKVLTLTSVSTLVLTSVLALLAPSGAQAQTCPSPNNGTCTVTTAQSTGFYENGSNSTGVLIISPTGSFSTNLEFRNGYAFANVNGTRTGDGTLTIQGGGTFNNSGGFYNGYGSGYGTGGLLSSGTGIGTGAVTIERGGTFTNSGTFFNGYGNAYSDGNGFLNIVGRGTGAGTLTINGGGRFDNTSNFVNGYAFGYGYNYGTGIATGTGTVTIRSGGLFNNSNSFENGHAFGGGGFFGTGTATATGTVNIEAGGTFLNAASGTISQIAGSSFSNAGTFTNLGSLYGGTFTNEAGGLFQHSAGSAIGDYNAIAVINNGTFDIGYGSASPATTAFTGTFTQSSTGKLALRADWATGTSDRLAITGNATLAGTVVVTALNFPSTPKLTKTFTDIVTTTGTLNATALTATDTAAVDYELIKKTQAIDLSATINFQGIQTGGLNSNQHNVGGALNTIFGGGTTLDFMPALMALQTNTQLGAALDQLAPSGTGANTISAMLAGKTFADQLLSCRTFGEGDANAFISEGQCLWARGTVRHVSIDDEDKSYGASETAPLYSAGAQVNIGGAWRLGGGLGYETSDLDTDAGNRTETDRLHLGGVVKYNPGPLLLAASVTGAFGWTDSARFVNIGGYAASATAKYDSDLISGRLTAAYLLPFNGMYVKPQVDVAYTHLSRDGYQEHSNQDIALSVAGSDDGVWSVTPMLEIGTEVRLTDGGAVRPFLRGGVTWRDSDNFATDASFLAAPGVGPFTVISAFDSTTADVAAGLDLITPSDTVLRVQYDGQFGDTTEQHIGSAKISVKF